MPKETKLPDGGMRVESAAVSVHLFKGLNNLVPGVNLGSLLGDANVDSLLAPVTGTLGLNLGTKSDVPGIKLGLAQTIAQAGGTRVLGQMQERQRAAELFRFPPPSRPPRLCPGPVACPSQRPSRHSSAPASGCGCTSAGVANVSSRLTRQYRMK